MNKSKTVSIKTLKDAADAAKDTPIFSHRKKDLGHGYWYRYVDVKASRNLYGAKGLSTFGATVVREEYPVMRVTPCGVVLDIGRANPRFVLDNCRKQYAHSNDKDALESFLYRKKAQRRILRNQLDQADAALIAGQSMMGKKP